MAKKNPDKETVTYEGDAPAPDRELRTGLATGSNALNPDQPDGHVTQATMVPLNDGEPSTTANTVVLTDDGKKGPAA